MQESFATCLLSVMLLFCIVADAAQNEFNVMDYGAKADGYTDDSLVTLDLISVMIFYSQINLSCFGILTCGGFGRVGIS
jgi:hypothetical protein